MDRDRAIREIAAAAVETERACGLPAELTAAMCALESGWLSSAPKNNAFGVKYSPRMHGSKQLLVTREWLFPEDVAPWVRGMPGRQVLAEEAGPDARGRKLYRVRDWFAAYPSLSAAMSDFARLMTTRRYAPSVARYRQHGDLSLLVADIARAGYTTTDADEYARRVMRVLEGPLQRAIDSARAETIGGGNVWTT